MILIERVGSINSLLLMAIGHLRAEGWRGRGNIAGVSSSSEWVDQHDADAILWAAYLDGSLCASARLCIRLSIRDIPDAAYYEGFESYFPLPVASINRLVVAKPATGLGIPKILDEWRMGVLESTKVKSAAAVIHVPVRVEAFVKYGFDILGESRLRTNPELSSFIFRYIFPDNAKDDNDYRISEEKLRHGGDSIITENRMGWSTNVPSLINKELFKHIENTESARVLDIGAGFGAMSLLALQKGAKVVANDINSVHLARFARYAARAGYDMFSLALGRFPNEISFLENTFDFIHASNVLHFLTPEELTEGLYLIHKWLVPGGRVFAQVSSPYVGNLKAFIPIYETKKAAKASVPGFVDNAHVYASAETRHGVACQLYLLEAEELAEIFRKANFDVEIAIDFRREGLPPEFYHDGRENVGIVARKKAA